MNLFHLLPLLLLAANFSGRPAPPAPKAAASIVIIKPKSHSTTESESVIPWAPQRKLEWDDFLCAPQKQGDAVASTSTSLGIAYQVKNGQLSYHITCNFSKEKSWGLLKTEYILAHEQAHFDITELHARLLYEALSTYEYKAASFKKDIATIYEGIVKDKEAMQDAYDRETDHSRRKSIQYQWLEKVDKLLSETEAYEAYP